MGCSASSLDTLIAKAIDDPSLSSLTSNSSFSSINSSSNNINNNNNNNNNNIAKTRSLSTSLVHHPALQKGDTHHLVCLTSSTYGSLNNINNNDNININNSCSFVEDVINTWELMEGLEDEEIMAINNNNNNNNVGFGGDFISKFSTLCNFNNTQKIPISKIVDFGSDFKVNSSNLCDFKNGQKIPISKIVDFGSSDFKVNSSNLCDFKNGQKIPISKIVDFDCDLKVKPSNVCDFNDAKAKPGSRFRLNLSDSYVFVEIPDEIVEVNSSSKPLWKHLSEESLLSKMDPNVSNAYDRALLGKKSTGLNPVVSKSKSMVVSNLSSGGSSCKMGECEDKIVLYFTSLRGIRKTYEDCSAVRMILRGFRVVVDERDISMDSSYRKELESVLDGKVMSLPQLFVRGKRIGGADDVKLMHETGELERILEGCRTKECGSVCRGCGDARFVPCSNCNGSRKVFQEVEGRTRRCPDCNENGLLRCPGCCS